MKIITLIAACAFSLSVMAGNDDPAPLSKYCAKMKDGKLTVMHNGSPLTSQVTLSNGTKISPDGTVIDKSGKRSYLKDGQCADLEGKVGKSKKESANNNKDFDNNDYESNNNDNMDYNKKDNQGAGTNTNTTKDGGYDRNNNNSKNNTNKNNQGIRTNTNTSNDRNDQNNNSNDYNRNQGTGAGTNTTNTNPKVPK